MTRDEFQAVAWAGFLRFAIEEKSIVAAFNAETGRAFQRPLLPIERMVDAVTGHDVDGSLKSDMDAFVEWITRNMWGWDEAPASYREYVEGKQP